MFERIAYLLVVITLCVIALVGNARAEVPTIQLGKEIYGNFSVCLEKDAMLKLAAADKLGKGGEVFSELSDKGICGNMPITLTVTKILDIYKRPDGTQITVAEATILNPKTKERVVIYIGTPANIVEAKT